MADTTTRDDERLLEQARGLAVHLEAELALVGSLVRAADERGQIMHVLVDHNKAGVSHECPSCQLTAWARSV